MSAPAERSEGLPSPVLPPQPLRPLALVPALAGAVLAFLALATDVDLGWNLPVALLGCAIAVVSLLDALGTFDRAPDPLALAAEPPVGAAPAPLAARSASDPTPSAEREPAAAPFPWLRGIELAAALVGLISALRLAVAGVLPAPVASSAVLVTGTFLWCVVAAHRLLEGLRAGRGPEPPLVARHGFWLVAACSLLHLPRLGSFSFIDPWESHYAEVTREMLVRADWLTFWWAQEGLFFSKPPLDFWMQGLSFRMLGVHTAPDQVLYGLAKGLAPAPEWAARFPIFLVGLVAVYALYRGVARCLGRRVGLLAGIVLSTMPYWFFLARQSMTDLPYVAPLTVAMALALIGFATDPEARVRDYPVRFGTRVLHLSAQHAVLGVFLLLTLPQILYLGTRNLTWLWNTEPRLFFRLHPDAYLIGSGGGNCGLPGNEACSLRWPVHADLLSQPMVMALVWLLLAGLFVAGARRERRTQRLAFLGAWIAVALSALAKGAPGLVIPLFSIACYLLASRRGRELGRLEVAALVLAVSAITLPWYVQCYQRHGWVFLDRLIFHDMYKRAFVHVHDTNAGADTSLRYYLEQLGYGTFPWTGLAVVGLVAWVRERLPLRRPAGVAPALAFLWFVTAFSLFSVSLTKFHHYALPAAPPLAVLAAQLVDRALGAVPPRAGRRAFAYWGAALGAATALPLGLFLAQPGRLSGAAPDAHAGGPSWAGVAAALLVGAALVAAMPLVARRGPRGDRPSSRAGALGAVALLAAPFVGLVGRDLTIRWPDDTEGPARLLHLFIYNYDRPWPPTVDFTAALAAFSIVATTLVALLAVPAARAHAAAVLVALGLVFATWGADLYLVAAAPHWGQRETIAAYYQRRAGPQEPIIAYQLNWKGENFYTGNRIAAFISDNAAFRAHVSGLRERGQRVAFFVTEQRRLKNLRRDLGEVRAIEVLVPPERNNKFTLVRVEL